MMFLVLGGGLWWWSRHKEKAARETRIDELLIDTQDFNYLIHRLLTKGKKDINVSASPPHVSIYSPEP